MNSKLIGAGCALAVLAYAAIQADRRVPGVDGKPLLPHAEAATAGDAYAPVAKAGAAPRRWDIVNHGTCCEGNLAASGDNTIVLLPTLVNANKIARSTDGGKSWTREYPPVDVSYPYGIEGDLQAHGNDMIYFGTELATAVVARSEDGGDTWSTPIEVPIASGGNDQAWSYLGPIKNLCPAPHTQSEDYVLAGWMRIGTAILFSCDGGRTWPIQAPLVGNGGGSRNVVCENNATPPADGGDTRIADPNFSRQKAGRSGAFGTDGRFYWAEPLDGQLYVCNTPDFGTSWEGTVHPLADGPAKGFLVSHAAFDERGTLYVLHGDKMYVSFDQGRSFRYTHKLPRYGKAGHVGDAGSAQYFAITGDRVHLALLEPVKGGKFGVWYLLAQGLDTAEPRWHQELADAVDQVRLDFMQIAVNGNGVPTIGYTSTLGMTQGPGDPEPVVQDEVTTASLNTTAPYAAIAAKPATGAAPLEVAFDASASSDLNGDALTYAFDFGDGTPAQVQPEPKTTHTYTAPGTFEARVTVTNSAAESSTAAVAVVVAGAKSASGNSILMGPMSPLALALLLGLWPLRRLARRPR